MSLVTWAASRWGSADSRFATRWQADHNNCYPTRVEQPSRHGAVQLRRRHIRAVRDIMDGIDEGRALATVTRGVGRDLGRAVKVSILSAQFITNPRSWCKRGGRLLGRHRSDEFL